MSQNVDLSVVGLQTLMLQGHMLQSHRPKANISRFASSCKTIFVFCVTPGELGYDMK